MEWKFERCSVRGVAESKCESLRNLSVEVVVEEFASEFTSEFIVSVLVANRPVGLELNSFPTLEAAKVEAQELLFTLRQAIDQILADGAK